MKERPYICNHCGKGFVSLYSMQRHEMIHTNSYRSVGSGRRLPGPTRLQVRSVCWPADSWTVLSSRALSWAD